MSAFVYLQDLGDIFATLDAEDDVGNAIGFSGTGFETANLQTSDITQVWRSAPATGDPGYYEFAVDLWAASSPPASVSWNLVAWINHDFPEDMLVRVRSGTTGAVSDHSDTMTWREFDMYFRTTTTRTDRYISIGFQSDDNFQISAGRLLIGLTVTASPPMAFGWSKALITKASDNRSAFNHANIDVFCQYYRFNMPFPTQTSSAANTLFAMQKALLGPKHWIFLIPDTADYDGYVVRQLSTPELIYVLPAHRDVAQLDLEEVSRGVRIGA